MKFATKQSLGLNRPPCIWLIRRFIDPHAEILLFPAETVLEEAAKAGAVPFHVPGVELHIDKARGRSTMDTFMDKYGLRGKDAALDLVAEIVSDATFRVLTNEARHPEAYGVRALTMGFKVTAPDDRTRIEKMCDLYDALYAACKKRLEPAVAPTGA